jgi:hypothetical protein
MFPAGSSARPLNSISACVARRRGSGRQGATVEITGISSDSATLHTGLVVSGVEATSSRFTSSRLISSRATSAARLGLDWLSLTITSASMPSPGAAARNCRTMKASAAEKAENGPVCGLT